MPESWCKQLGFEQIGKEGQSSLHERKPSLSLTNDNAKPKKRRFSPLVCSIWQLRNGHCSGNTRPMPELPEVETTRRGIEPHVVGVTVSDVIVRRSDLRQPVSPCLDQITGQQITGIRRRAKYLLLDVADGTTVLIHLGMSGSLRVIPASAEWKTHDHIGLSLSNGRQLRFHDPRRFGLVLRLTEPEPLDHALLAKLGPEPFADNFTPAYLKAAICTRGTAIKLAIMDNAVVVGVGNIYAAEALFRAGIQPLAAANRLSLGRLAKLVAAIQAVLSEAIDSGGTTLRDFLQSDGKPGYFKQRLNVYDRKGEPCRTCATAIRHSVLGQRSTYWCSKCQR
jgi:formamidopyrimidine-DNA glycosylase